MNPQTGRWHGASAPRPSARKGTSWRLQAISAGQHLENVDHVNPASFVTYTAPAVPLSGRLTVMYKVMPVAFSIRMTAVSGEDSYPVGSQVSPHFKLQAPKSYNLKSPRTLIAQALNPKPSMPQSLNPEIPPEVPKSPQSSSRVALPACSHTCGGLRESLLPVKSRVVF